VAGQRRGGMAASASGDSACYVAMQYTRRRTGRVVRAGSYSHTRAALSYHGAGARGAEAAACELRRGHVPSLVAVSGRAQGLRAEGQAADHDVCTMEGTSATPAGQRSSFAQP
jgi:hypothetical protein